MAVYNVDRPLGREVYIVPVMLQDPEIKGVLDALQAHFSDSLTSWEVDFVSSVVDQFERRGMLSERQRETLDRIFERVSAGGKVSRSQDDA